MQTPSAQQGTVMKRLIQTTDSLLVEAAAGSGKTTTLEMAIQAINSMNAMYNILYVVFNRSTQKEAKKRFGKKYFNLDILTSHGLGLRDLNQNSMGEVKLDDAKTFKLISRYEKDRNKQKEIRKLITFVLAADVNIEYADCLDQIANVAAFYGIKSKDNEIYRITRQVIFESQEMRNIISYDDMIDQPLNTGVPPFKKYDFILVDEAQDLNNQQMRFITRYAHPVTRYVCVGDRFQSIYGFRGANFDAMDTLKQYLGLHELPLSVCYRCGTEIINFARSITDTIEAAPKAIAGQIIVRPPHEITKTYDELNNGDMVVCRTNAPLVRVALNLLREGKKPNLLGRDFSKTLITLVQRFSSTPDWDVFNEKFKGWCNKQTEKLFDLDRAQELEMFHDRIEAIEVLCEGLESPTGLVPKIQSIFAEAVHGGIKLATIHKSKGLEAGKVIFLDYGNVPHPMAYKSANKEQALRQEINLKYVAITRAKHTLIMQDLAQ